MCLVNAMLHNKACLHETRSFFRGTRCLRYVLRFEKYHDRSSIKFHDQRDVDDIDLI